jgi:polyhydroxyalkanoate synthesis repressor PhaR
MMAPTQTPKTNPIVIKKYANRRLYNTDTSSYVTLDDLCTMIKNGEEIIVFDAKNGDDITRGVLTQIIVEQENKGQSLLPTSFLRQLIGFYGNNMQGLVPGYLDYTMQNFSKNQTQIRDYFTSAVGSMLPAPMSTAIEEMSKQNMAMFEQGMRMFTQFAETAHKNAGSSTAAKMPKVDGIDEETPDDGVASAAPTPAPAPSHLRAVATPAPSPAPAPAATPAPAAAKPAPVSAPYSAPEVEDDASIKQMQTRLDDLQKQIAALGQSTKE